MQFNRYIPFGRIESFLNALRDPPSNNSLDPAVKHFIDTQSAAEFPSPFPTDLDIITLPDETFIELCDQLPVNTVIFEHEGQLTSSAVFPHNYECFIVRHLNSLNAAMHHHDFFEVCYVWEGSCTQYTASQSFPMVPGDFLIIPPGVEHTVSIHGDKTVLFNIMVRADTLHASSLSLLVQHCAVSEVLRHFLLEKDRKGCVLIQTDNSTVLKRIVKHLTQECYTNQDFFCDFAINVFNQLFCYILMSGELKTDYMCLPDNFSLFAILREIQQNYRTVTLKSLSDKYFFSEEHLSRLIKKMTGKTFSTLLRETRVNQAKLLIARTELSIDAVSELVGYSDASSFTKAFSASVGLSPTQYRKMALA